MAKFAGNIVLRQYFGMVVIAISVLCGCSKNYEGLSEVPQESAAPTPPLTSESLVSLNALFPYDTVSTALTSAVPSTMSFQGRQNVCMQVNKQVQKSVEKAIGGDVGKFVGGVVRVITTIVTVDTLENLCLDVDYHATMTRDGGVIVSQGADGFRISVPLRIDGGAGFSGDLAHFLSLSNKNFRASIIALADLKLGMHEDWCPDVQVSPDFVWRDKAQLEVAGKFWIKIDDQVGPAVKKAMSDAAAHLPAALTCDRMKQLVQPLWHIYNVPLPSLAGQSSNVIVTPKRVGFSGFSYSPTGARLAMMLTADTEVTVGKSTAGSSGQVATPGGQSSNLPLPKLETIPVEEDALNLSVPILVPTRAFKKLQQMRWSIRPSRGSRDR